MEWKKGRQEVEARGWKVKHIHTRRTELERCNLVVDLRRSPADSVPLHDHGERTNQNTIAKIILVEPRFAAPDGDVIRFCECNLTFDFSFFRYWVLPC